MNICTLVKSCKKEEFLWAKVLRDHPSDIFIYYGDKRIKKNHIYGSNIILNCDDTWRGLTDKNKELWSYVSCCEDLLNYSHFYIIDLPEAVFNGKLVYAELRKIESYFNSSNEINIDNLSINDCDYLSHKILNRNSNAWGATYSTSYYHFGKLQENDSLARTPIDGQKILFCPGSGTMFSRKSFKEISHFISDDENQEFIQSFHGGIHEDILSGHILKTQKIFPSIFPLDLCLDNFDLLFPNTKSRLMDLLEKKDESSFSKYVTILKDNYDKKGSDSYATNLKKSLNLLKLLDQIDIPKESIDYCYLELHIMILKDDYREFKNKIYSMIKKNSLQNQIYFSNLADLSRSVSKKNNQNFYEPILSLLDKFFPEFNFRFKLKIDLFKAKDDLNSIYKLVKELDDYKSADNEIYKLYGLGILIDGNYYKPLKKLINAKHDSYLLQITKVKYLLAKNDLKKAIMLFKSLKPMNKVQKIIKYRLEYQIAKRKNDTSLCFDIIFRLNEGNVMEENLKASIIKYLCRKGFADKCSDHMGFAHNTPNISSAKKIFNRKIKSIS